MQKFTLHEIYHQTNIQYFYTEFHRDLNNSYIEIFHPIYNNIRILDYCNYLVISNNTRPYPWNNKKVIDLTESDWPSQVNKLIPHNLKDIINSLSKLPDYWAIVDQDTCSSKIKSEAIEGALNITDIIERLNLPLPRIYPHCSGGIGFNWDNCNIEIYTEDDNNIEFLYEFDDGKVIEFDIV